MKKISILKNLLTIFLIVFLVIGILAGILAIYKGNVIIDEQSGFFRNNMRFGGDFYTEIYSVAEGSRIELIEIDNTLCYSLGWFLIIFGLTDISGFGFLLMKVVENKVISKINFQTIADEKEITVMPDEEYAG